MGVGTGEAELRGEDYFGPALNRAARMVGAGHGGQILLAATTAALVDGVELVDLDEHRLRDLSGAHRLFQVRARGLRDGFPAVRTLDDIPGNLPSLVTSFVGRDAEIEALVAAVRAHRLVTLTGVGGVGKTRLALQVAGELVPDFAEGVWLVELAPVGDPGVVGDVVASTLGITPRAGLSMRDAVAEALAVRRVLVVLDNCEHVLDAAADLVEAVLARTPTVHVIATSREGLRVGVEHLWPVPSLDVGDGSAAVALFVERARAVLPDFTLGEGNDDAVAEICRRLDGIPLAIELAAARMVSMSPQDVRDRLGDRFRLLSGSRRGLERHQTLRHAAQWSFNLLSDVERRLLCSCSVFAGGFDLDAAVAVDGEADEYEVLDLLDSLVRKSLLGAQHTGGHARYAMLETIRQYAEEVLVFAGRAETARHRHSAHFAGQADKNRAMWWSQAQREANVWFDTEAANLRAGFRWAADRGDLDTATSIATAPALTMSSMRLEAAGWAEELIDAARAARLRRLPWLYRAASNCVDGGRVDDAVGFVEAGLAFDTDPGYEPEPDGLAYWWAAGVYMQTERLKDALDVVDTGIERFGDPTVALRQQRVMVLMRLGRGSEAMAAAADTLAAAEATAIPHRIGMALGMYGLAFVGSDPAKALAAGRRAVGVMRDSHNRHGEANVRTYAAMLESRHGDPRAALDTIDHAITMFQQSGATQRLTMADGVLMELFNRCARPDVAATVYGVATRHGVAAESLSRLAGRLRDILGPERFDECVATGAAMDRAEAIRYERAQIRTTRDQLGAET